MSDEFTREQLQDYINGRRPVVIRLAAFALKQMKRAERAEALLDERDAPYAELTAARAVVEAARVQYNEYDYTAPELGAAIREYDRVIKERG